MFFTKSTLAQTWKRFAFLPYHDLVFPRLFHLLPFLLTCYSIAIPTPNFLPFRSSHELSIVLAWPFVASDLHSRLRGREEKQLRSLCHRHCITQLLRARLICTKFTVRYRRLPLSERRATYKVGPEKPIACAYLRRALVRLNGLERKHEERTLSSDSEVG